MVAHCDVSASLPSVARPACVNLTLAWTPLSEDVCVAISVAGLNGACDRPTSKAAREGSSEASASAPVDTSRPHPEDTTNAAVRMRCNTHAISAYRYQAFSVAL